MNLYEKVSRMRMKGFFKYSNITTFLVVAGVLLAPFSSLSKTTSSPPHPLKNYTESEAIVELENPGDAAKLASENNLTVVPLDPSNEDNFYLVKSPSGKNTQKLIRELRQNSFVKSVQKNFRYKLLSKTPNDSYISRQWALFDQANVSGGVSAFSAWDMEAQKGQRDVVIAVIDTGVNTRHKDIKKNLSKGSAKGKNFEHPKKKLSDEDGHGSFIAGIIAGQTNNRKGIAGGSLYNHLRVMALRFDFTTSQAIEAINYAKNKNVPVINASWGSYGDEGLDLALKDTIAAYSGVLVTAAGNNSYNHDDGNADHKMYPCDFELENIICVGASDKNGSLTDYSDYSPSFVDVVAPGGNEENLLIGLAGSKSFYTEAEGSSLSAASVSAEAGLIISKYPNLSSAQVIEIIKNSVDTEPSLSGKVSSGGKVNFLKALQNAAVY